MESKFNTILQDVDAVIARDPATKSRTEAILCSSGLHCIIIYRFSHWLWSKNFRLTARIVSQIARFLTGIEIHPGATIGKRVFIDHGMGVVVGETAIVGDDVLIYQGVILGGTSTQKTKRHPTVEKGAIIGAGAKVMGNITVGQYSKIGTGAVVLKDVPPDSTCVGVPGRIVRSKNAENIEIQHKTVDLDHNKLPDPVADAINTLTKHLKENDKHIKILYEKNSICLTEDDEDELDDLLKK